MRHVVVEAVLWGQWCFPPPTHANTTECESAGWGVGPAPEGPHLVKGNASSPSLWARCRVPSLCGVGWSSAVSINHLGFGAG